MATNSTHFVRYRTKESAVDEQYITFSSRAPKQMPTAGDHPVIQKLAETNPDVVENVMRLIQVLIGQEKTFFAWLGASVANMELFMEDPVSALKQGDPALPDSFYEELASLPKINAKKE